MKEKLGHKRHTNFEHTTKIAKSENTWKKTNSNGDLVKEK